MRGRPVPFPVDGIPPALRPPPFHKGGGRTLCAPTKYVPRADEDIGPYGQRKHVGRGLPPTFRHSEAPKGPWESVLLEWEIRIAASGLRPSSQ